MFGELHRQRPSRASHGHQRMLPTPSQQTTAGGGQGGRVTPPEFLLHPKHSARRGWVFRGEQNKNPHLPGGHGDRNSLTDIAPPDS